MLYTDQSLNNELCKSLLALALEKLVQTVYNIQITVVRCLIMLRRNKTVCIVLALHIFRHNANITILLKDIPAAYSIFICG